MKITDMKQGVVFTFWGHTFIVKAVQIETHCPSIIADDIDNGQECEIPIGFLSECEPVLS